MNQGMRKLVQLGRDDERQEEEDRDADGQGIVGLYGALPFVQRVVRVGSLFLPLQHDATIALPSYKLI